MDTELDYKLLYKVRGEIAKDFSGTRTNLTSILWDLFDYDYDVVWFDEAWSDYLKVKIEPTSLVVLGRNWGDKPTSSKFNHRTADGVYSDHAKFCKWVQDQHSYGRTYWHAIKSTYRGHRKDKPTKFVVAQDADKIVCIIRIYQK